MAKLFMHFSYHYMKAISCMEYFMEYFMGIKATYE